jgi:hypothetical protein
MLMKLSEEDAKRHAELWEKARTSPQWERYLNELRADFVRLSKKYGFPNDPKRIAITFEGEVLLWEE